jgi:hypothetical protein
VIRDLAPRDQKPVRDLVLEGMRERWGDAYDPSANSDLGDIAANYVDRGAEVVVIEIGGEIVDQQPASRRAGDAPTLRGREGRRRPSPHPGNHRLAKVRRGRAVPHPPVG